MLGVVLIGSLEAVVDAAANDVDGEVYVGCDAASRDAAGRVAEVCVEVLDLGRPVAGDNAFDTRADGPARERTAVLLDIIEAVSYADITSEERKSALRIPAKITAAKAD